MDFLVEEIDQSTLSRKKTVFYHTRAQHFRKTALYFSRGNAQINLQPQKRTNFLLKRLAFMLQSPTFPPKIFPNSKSKNSNTNIPAFPQKSPAFRQKKPTFQSRKCKNQISVIKEPHISATRCLNLCKGDMYFRKRALRFEELHESNLCCKRALRFRWRVLPLPLKSLTFRAEALLNFCNKYF